MKLLTQLAAVFLYNFILLNAEVTVLKSGQVIYDKSPKLRIRGSNFDADDHNIILELGISGGTPLKGDKDYLITKDADGDGLILKLLGNRKWADLTNRTPPVALILSSVKFEPDGKNMLPEPVPVANILSTPTVEENTEVLYISASNELRINGTGFIGAKKVDLYFQPPLVKEVAYEDVSKYPLSKNTLVLRLRHGYKWREDAGALSILGVDTGGGPVKVDGEDGVQVADVQTNLEFHGVTVESTVDEQLLYANDADIKIKGSGFNPVGNLLRFSNNLLGNNVNYTTVSQDEDSIVLRLVPGSLWRKNYENLPGALTILAINAGQGYVATGPTNAQKGRDIAMIFEPPQVFSSNKKIYKTHSHELHIKGAGFPIKASISRPQLKFSPPLVEETDYSIRVLNRTEIEITLQDGRQWSQEAGPLLVTAINTRGDEAGWVTLPGDGVHVADVQDDLDTVSSSGVEVFPSGLKVYQSALRQSIAITGTGFKDTIQFTFEPALKAGVDYDLNFENKNKVVLKLKVDKKWRSDAGFIIAKSIKLDKSGKDIALAGSDGIRVAVVLEDPVVKSSKDTYHESQSKLVVVEGTGFTTVTDTVLAIRPTDKKAYKILGVLDESIRVQLKPDSAWLPAFSTLKDEEETKKVPLQVISIDTGAGNIVFDEAITIGYVVKDRVGVVCDDSCEFAFDGVCDDGSEPNDQYYYSNNNKYEDDDLGGFYEGEEGEKESSGGKNKQSQEYDDYYMENEDYQVSACVEGTDCTDCGGIDAVVDYTKPLEPDSGVESCTNTCVYQRDGVCDDPRGTKYCEIGTDCQDCGPVGADNFTRSDDDGWWDDDDDYWTFNDGNFLDQTKGLEANRAKVKVFKKNDSTGPAAMFLIVLEGMVYTVGAIFAAAALYLLNRWYKGQNVPFMNVFNADSGNNSHDYEMATTNLKRMPITPDVIRT